MKLPFFWFGLAFLSAFATAPLRSAVVVNLDFTATAAGPLASKANAGTLGGTFDKDGADTPAVTVVSGVNALTLDGNGDWYVGPEVPSALTGSGVRSVEVWAHNPGIQAEESLIAWGRLGTTLANASYNYGNSTALGAVSHGTSDAAWFSPTFNASTIAPVQNQWHHLVYTYDGTLLRLYVDGVLSNYKSQGALATAAQSTLATPLRFVLGNQNQADGTRLNTASQLFSGSIAKVRVHDAVLNADQIATQFNAEAATFGKTPAASPAAPTILSFTPSTRNFTAGSPVTLSWSVDAAASVSLTNIGSVGVSGTASVSPSARTTYTLSAVRGASTVTRDVTLVPSGDSPLTLAHRWSFAEPVGSTSFTDSVAGRVASLVGGGSCDGSKVVLTGGASDSAPFVNLPNGLISKIPGDLTIEGWATVSGVQAWSRLFDFGNSLGGEFNTTGGTGAGSEYLFFSAQQAGTTRTNRLGFKRLGTEVFADCGTNPSLSSQFHFAVVYSLYGNNGSPQIRVYKSGITGGVPTATVLAGTLNTTYYPADLLDVNNFLGRSNGTTDRNLTGSFTEFRIWDGALSATEISDNFTLGPDVLSNKPRINSFTVSPAGFSLGQQVTLSWSSTGATASIDNGVGAVPPTGSILVSPTATTTYTLTSSNGAQSATATVTVNRLDSPLTLAHRWSFNEPAGSATFADSVTGLAAKAATLKGAGGSSNGTAVVLPGGAPATQAYVDLPNGILSSRTKDVTIEGWVTVSGAQNWQRVFDIGTGSAGEVTAAGGTFNGTRYLTLAAQTGTDTTKNKLAFTNLAAGTVTENQCTTPAPGPGAEFHFAVVYQRVGPEGTPYVRYYRDGVFMSSFNTAYDLTSLPDVNCFLGRSNYSGDNNTQGSFNEFRVWDGAFNEQDVANSRAAGPNALTQRPSVTRLLTTPAYVYEGQTASLDYAFESPTAFTASLAPLGAALSARAGTITVSPSTSTVYKLNVANAAGSASGTWELRVLPSRPVVANSAVTTALNTAATIPFTAADPRGLAVTYTVATPPVSGTLSGTGASRIYTPAAGFAGTDTFTYTASSGLAPSLPATVTITVSPAATAPADILASSYEIDAGLPAGSLLARLVAVDANPGDTHTFSLVAGIGDTGNATCSLSGRQLLTTAAIPASGTLSVRVRATDSTSLSVEKVLVFNIVPAVNTVRINEVYYNPPRPELETEFIELVNPTNAAVDLSGWHFSKGVAYTFPTGASIPAGGYVVVAQNPAALLAVYNVTAFGPWTGGLSGDGDTIVLRDALDGKVDTVDYQSSSPWPVASNNDGPSMELINPTLDNDHGSNWRPSVGTAAAVSYVSAGAAGWHYRKGTSEPSATGLWRAQNFTEDGTWLTGTAPIGLPLTGNVGIETGIAAIATPLADMAGAYNTVYFRKTFTVSGDIPRALLLRVLHNDAAIVWINGVEVGRFSVRPGEQGYNSADYYENGNDPWVEQVILNTQNYLVAGTNTLAIQGFSKAPVIRAGQDDAANYGSYDFAIDAELRTMTETQPTPGRVNSVFAANAAPAVREVDHSPKSPTSVDPIVVTARVTDPQGVASVVLQYQVVAPGNFIPAVIPFTPAQLAANPLAVRPANTAYETGWTSLPMRDDGTGGDLAAGDAVYAATIPAQAHRALVRYRITVTDIPGASARIPYADDPSLNFAAFVYNGVPSIVAGTTVVSSDDLSALPTYHVIMRAADVTTLLGYNAADQIANSISLNALLARRTENWPAAFVYDGKVYDNINMRLRGGNSRYNGTARRHFRIAFNKGAALQAKDESGNPYPVKWKTLLVNKMFGNKNYYDWGIPYEVGGKMWRLQGVPIPQSHYFQFRLVQNASEAGALATGDFFGIFQAIEFSDGQFLKARNLPDGNLYKLSDWTQNGEMTERHAGVGAPPHHEDLDNFRYNVHPAASDSFLNTYVQMDNWYRMNAVQEAIRHYDIFTEPTGRHRVKNLILYFQPQAGNPLGQCIVTPYDWDASFGPNWNNGYDTVHNALYNRAQFPDSPTWGAGAIVNRTATEHIRHRNALRDFRDLVFQPEVVNNIIDDQVAKIARVWRADRYRWPVTGAGADHIDGPYFKAQDMKNFCFSYWSDTTANGDPAVAGPNGRAGFLDGLADGSDPQVGSPAADSGFIPVQPVLTYSGVASYPVDGINLTTSAFSDPQGAGTFGAIQWRLAEVTDPTAPAYDAAAARMYEATALWTSGELPAFASTAHIPANYLRFGHAYRARVRHKDNSGRWSHWSSPVQFTATAPALFNTVKDSLVVSEIMYHPAAPSAAELAVNPAWLSSDFEYIRIRNVHPTQTLDLTAVRFTKGVDFDFAGSSLTSLAPGASALVARNPAALAARLGAGQTPIAGQWQVGDGLSGTGERLKLSYAAGETLRDFNYGVGGDWPNPNPGTAISLKNAAANPDHALGYNWRLSSMTAPLAVADAYSLGEDASLLSPAPGVLGNDRDYNGTPLTASLVGAVSTGNLSLLPDGSVSYTPPANFSGTATFTYQVDEGGVKSAPVTVTITVTPVNDAPVFAANPIALNAAAGAALAGQLAASDPDAGDVLSFAKQSGPAWLTVSPSGALGGTPAAGDAGLNAFTVSVSDGALSATATLNVTVTASGPSFTGFTGAHFTPAERADPLVSGPAADPDGDGVPNLLEYAFGTDPRQGSRASFPQSRLVTVGAGQHAALTYTRLKGATDLSFVPEFSNSPDNAGFTASAFTQVSLVDNGDGTETLTVRDNTPSGSQARFVRLRVIQN